MELEMTAFHACLVPSVLVDFMLGDFQASTQLIASRATCVGAGCQAGNAVLGGTSNSNVPSVVVVVKMTTRQTPVRAFLIPPPLPSPAAAAAATAATPRNPRSVTLGSCVHIAATDIL